MPEPFGKGKPSIATGQIAYTWNGRRIYDFVSTAVQEGMLKAADAGQEYWNETVWGNDLPNDKHPEATGIERDAGSFDVNLGADAKVILTVSVDQSQAPWAIYEEFGTSHRAAHFPVREVVDWLGPRVSRYVLREIKRAQREQA